jgi:Family of unknown function (DUF6688)
MIPKSYEFALVALSPCCRLRFGRLARQIYDRVGLPVSRYLRTRWAADLAYLIMKPLEWLFYLALLMRIAMTPKHESIECIVHEGSTEK